MHLETWTISYFIQRIIRTLTIDHIDFYAAVKVLSACLYREDPIDVENVKLALRVGRLGSRNKKDESKGMTDAEIYKN